MKVFESNFVYDVFVWSDFVLWFTFTSKAIPVAKRKSMAEHEPVDNTVNRRTMRNKNCSTFTNISNSQTGYKMVINGQPQ